MSTKVTDMRSFDKNYYFDLAPKQAVIACYEQQERHNYNTWTYPDDHPFLQEGNYYFFCGNYAARKVTISFL